MVSVSRGASVAHGGGLDQFLYGRNRDQEQLDSSLFHLFEGVELLCFPGVRGGLMFRDGVEDRKPYPSKR